MIAICPVLLAGAQTSRFQHARLPTGHQVDPGQLDQVVVNLVVNSADALPNGGTISLETSNPTLTEGDVATYPYVTPGGYVSLIVRDNGAGMDEAVRTRAFEPFFTTKPIGKGTGLGLSTVYGIVKQSGGYVWVASAPGAGTAATRDGSRSAIARR